MITCSKIGTMGRFGNQMFQYATLYSIAKEKNFEFGVPFHNTSNNEYFHFCLPDIFKNLTAKNSLNKIFQYSFEEKNFNYDNNILNIDDNTDIIGFFQTEKYFKKYRNDIFKEYEFPEQIKEKAREIKEQIGPCISLHIRLTDYLLSSQKHPICEKRYYMDALDNLPNDIPIILFSDDKQAAKNYLNLNKKIIILENVDKFFEMHLMSLCEYHIIANSSFSWWGAWLSNSKLTIAPKQWFGENCNIKKWDDIYKDGWIVL